MSIGAPPVGDDPLGQHDHVPGLLLAVDDDAAEAVALQRRHRPTSSWRLIGAAYPRAYGSRSRRMLGVRSRAAPAPIEIREEVQG